MIVATIPPDEQERLADLRALNLLDSAPDTRYDQIVQILRNVFDVPIAYIALLDSDRQWLMAKCGLQVDQTGRDISFCGHTIVNGDTLHVPDALRDERFHDNPLVTDEPHIRFYAGQPLAGPKGYPVGTLCIAGPEPRTLTADQLRLLKDFGKLVEYEMNTLDVVRSQHELLTARQALEESRQRLDDELAEAAAYVRSLLPPRLTGEISTDWRYLTSSQVGGDLFGYHSLDDRYMAFYLLDVSGHGVGASLLSISVYDTLRLRTLPDTRFERPDEVLGGLNQAYPMNDNNGKYFTIWYGVYDTRTRVMRYASAGHPPALALGPEGGLHRLGERSFMIGLSSESVYGSSQFHVAPGTRIYLFSDGVYDVRNPQGDRLNYDKLVDLIAVLGRKASGRVGEIQRSIQTMQQADAFDDDFSLLEIEFK